jgi:hypothetical protein
VDAARACLRTVLAESTRDAEFVEIDVTAEDTPEELRSWGSPTILVDGVDVAGGAPAGRSCRLYQTSETPGVPPRALIRAALAKG